LGREGLIQLTNKEATVHQFASNSTPIRVRRAAVTVAALASLGALTLSATVRADNQDTIDYRQHIMKTMAAQVGAIELIVQSKVPAEDNSNLATHVKILALTAGTAKSAFKDNVAGGEAKPNIWSGSGLSADFAKRMDELAANTANLDKTTSGNASEVAGKLQSVLTCKGCHDQYREQKKK
jgi:cytochrome c556